MTAHHPDLRLLNDYTAGSISIAEAICINAHLDQCASCQQQIDTLKQLGGELLEASAPAVVDSELLEKILVKIDRSDSMDITAVPDGANTKCNSEASQTTTALQKLIPNGYKSLRWRRLGSQLEVARLPATDHSHKLSLYRIQPGGRIAEHGHHGDELTVVLKGAFSDGSGIYTEGDFLFCDSDDVHRPIATQDGECLCLAAETAPIKFTGWPAKILNPLLHLEQMLSR